MRLANNINGRTDVINVIMPGHEGFRFANIL